MKTSSNDLIELIRSMTRTEKRYFKVNLNANSNRYREIFTKLDSISIFQESNFIKELPIKWQNQWPHIKLNLYRVLLSSLKNYHSSTNKSIQIKNFIAQAEVLFSKGLYKQAEKQLLIAEKLAFKYEKIGLIQEIFKWKEAILLVHLAEKKSIESTTILLQKKEQIYAQSVEITDLRKLYFKITIPIRKSGFIRDSKQLQEIENSLSEIPLFHSNKWQSNEAQFLALVIQSTYLIYAQSNYKKASKLLNGYLNDQSKEEFALEFPQVHIDALYFFGASELYSNQFDSVRSVIQQIREIAPTSNDLYFEIKVRSTVLELELAVRENLEEHKFDSIKKLEQELISTSHSIMNLYKALFYFNISKLLFFQKKFKLSIQYLQKLLTTPSLKVKDDVIAYSSLLLLLAHAELRNTETINYLLPGTKATLVKLNRYWKTEELIICSITAISSNNKSDIKIFKDSILNLSKLPLEYRFNEDLDIHRWLNSSALF